MYTVHVHIRGSLICLQEEHRQILLLPFSSVFKIFFFLQRIVVLHRILHRIIVLCPWRASGPQLPMWETKAFLWEVQLRYSDSPLRREKEEEELNTGEGGRWILGNRHPQRFKATIL